MPATILDVPQVGSAYVSDIDGGDFTEKDGSEERGHERDASGRFVGFGVFVVEAKDLRATEALYCVSMDKDLESAGNLRDGRCFQ